VAGGSGDMTIFFGSHLHATVPNRSERIRYSVDFRIFHSEDLRRRVGAKNQDSAAKNVEFGLATCCGPRTSNLIPNWSSD
jgi:hypothetical protein